MMNTIESLCSPALYPVVSVIIATYNREEYIGKAVESVLNQTYANFELIVLDDGSTDETRAVLNQFSDQRLRVYFLENTGPANARNKGIEISRGEYIAFLDSDDLWYPKMLARTVQFLESHRKIDLVCGGWDMINDDGNAISGVYSPIAFQKSVETDFLASILRRSLFPIHSVLIRKKCFTQCGGFNANLLAFEDYELWIRFASFKCDIVFIDEPVAHWRHHRMPKRSDLKEGLELSVQSLLEVLRANKNIRNKYDILLEYLELRIWIEQSVYFKKNESNEEMEICVNRVSDLLTDIPFEPELFFYFYSQVYESSSVIKIKKSLEEKIPQSNLRNFQIQLLRRKYKLLVSKKSIFKLGLVLIRMLFTDPKWMFNKFTSR